MVTTLNRTSVRRRGPGARLVDNLTARALGLPKPTTDYTLTTGLRIPTRDGETLAADLYRPVNAPSGTLLARGPYGRGMPHSLLVARWYAARGYQVLFVSSRGTFGSAGEFEPERTEAEDGQDVVAWLRAQEWFTGSFATVGGSYLGYTQWALLSEPPEELVASVISMAPHDFSRHHWGTGAFNLDMLGWSDLIAHQEERGRAMRQLTAGRRLRPVLAELPLAEAGSRYFGTAAPWYREVVSRPDLSDPFWTPTQQAAALEKVAVPVLLLGGWQDIFFEQTMVQYTRLRERGVDVALTVGPWTHIELATTAAGRIARETLDWLDHHLAGRNGKRRAPVTVHVMGTGEWRDYPSWPAATASRTLFLSPGNTLAEEPPADTAESVFTFDPATPTPTVSGPLMSAGGFRDDTELAQRADVLTFTGAALKEDLEVLGAPEVQLWHSTDNPHVDLLVRVSDVSPDGKSRNVTEAYQRLDPERAPGPVTIRLRDTAYRFRAGHRIRLIVAGGSHPQFARNLGTGDHPGLGSTLKPARHTIAHDADHPSRLTLPVA